MTTESAPAVTLDELRREFPDWKLWTSDDAAWYATHPTRTTKAEQDLGWARTVDADTAEELRELLKAQAELRGGDAVEPRFTTGDLR